MIRSESQSRIHHLLLVPGKERSSFELMRHAYLQFLALGSSARIYSLLPLGSEFEAVVPMEANQKNLKLIDLMVVIGDN